MLSGLMTIIWIPWRSDGSMFHLIPETWTLCCFFYQWTKVPSNMNKALFRNIFRMSNNSCDCTLKFFKTTFWNFYFFYFISDLFERLFCFISVSPTMFIANTWKFCYCLSWSECSNKLCLKTRKMWEWDDSRKKKLTTHVCQVQDYNSECIWIYL